MKSLYDYKNILDSVMLLVKLSNKGIAKRFALNAKKKNQKTKTTKNPHHPQSYIGKEWKLPSEFPMKYQNFSVKIF